jgi:hypothetical protein
MAARFAAEAREAIAAAVDAGTTPADLAWELTTPAAPRRSTGRTSTASSPICTRTSPSAPQHP